MPNDGSRRRRPRPPQRQDSIPPPAAPQPLWPEGAADPARPPGQAHPAPERREAPTPSDGRPLTLGETFTLIQTWYGKLQGTWRERLLGGVFVLVAAALVWAALSLAIPWAGGILATVQGLLALDLPWPPVPPPDDPSVGGELGIGTAARVAAPLVLATFWFAAAYHLDRSGRRVFGASEVPGVRHSVGYTLMAVLVVFPLILLGLVSGAWGIFALIAWASAHDRWGTALGLLALLLAVAALVRLANAVLDRRAAGP